jgi:hypothetical protein
VAVERRMHVLGLSPREQFLVRLLFSNLMAAYIDKAIQEAPVLKTQEASEASSSRTIDMFWRHNEICDLLCTEASMSRAKSKMIMLDSHMMKLLLFAVNGYDPRNCLLTDRQRGYLETGFDELREKVVDSSYFKYDKWEIDRVRNSGQG